MTRSRNRSARSIRQKQHLLDVKDHVLLVVGVSDEVDSPQTSILAVGVMTKVQGIVGSRCRSRRSRSHLVAGVEALEGVSEATLGTVGGEGGGVISSTSHGTVPVTYQGVRNLDKHK